MHRRGARLGRWSGRVKGEFLHLIDLLARRTVPAAGVSIGLTRRCPLSCAHCSTNSTATSEEIAAEVLVDFVASFGTEDPPEFLMMSGGEPMLRPRLVREHAERAGAVGCRSCVLSGMFFARGAGRIPPPIRAAIDAVDHFSVSLDAFHEREVPRANVLRVLDTVLSSGTDVSIHAVGLDGDDPYLEELTAEVRRAFDDRVPIFVNTVNAFGRAREWYVPPELPQLAGIGASPCQLAAWPLVSWDGTVTACGNEDVVDGPAPPHLRLGHARDGWPAIQARCRASSMARAIRLYGPLYVADRLAADGTPGCDGYCETCRALSDDPALEERVVALMAQPSTTTVEAVAADLQLRDGALGFTRRYGTERYAELALLGAPP
jgi:pyruvate-formate lyase-activating enzyme